MFFDPITLSLAKAYSDSKGGYVEPGKTVFNGAVNTVEDRVQLIPTEAPVELTEGKKYTLGIDDNGVKKPVFTSVAKMGEVEGAMCPCIGNLSLANGDEASNTGEPILFVSANIPDAFVGVMFIQSEDANRFADANVYVEQTETVHTIDPKYLPGAVLPVVELSTVIDFTVGGTPSLTEADGALLAEAVKTNSPVAIKFHDNNGILFNCVFYRMSMGDMVMLQTLLMNNDATNIVMFMDMGAGWVYSAYPKA